MFSKNKEIALTDCINTYNRKVKRICEMHYKVLGQCYIRYKKNDDVSINKMYNAYVEFQSYLDDNTEWFVSEPKVVTLEDFNRVLSLHSSNIIEIDCMQKKFKLKGK